MTARCPIVIGIVAMLLLVAMMSGITQADVGPIDHDVVVRLDNCDIRWINSFNPYSIIVTNDTANFNTNAGEFGLQIWSDAQIDLFIDRWEPYTWGPYSFNALGTGANASFVLSGVNPGSTYDITIDDVTTRQYTASGELSWTLSSITDSTVFIRLVSTSPIFTSSPIIALYSETDWEYDVRVFPTPGVGPNSQVTLTVEKMAWWMTWEYNIWQLHGSPPHKGEFEVSIRATGPGGSSWQNFTVYVYAEDIGFTSSPQLNIQKFGQYSYTVEGYPDYARFAALEYPSWLHWNPFKHSFDGQAIKAGTFQVSVTIYTNDLAEVQTWTITVTEGEHTPGFADTTPSIGSDLSLLYIAIGGGAIFVMLTAFFFGRRR
jgi:hypothetical protein